MSSRIYILGKTHTQCKTFERFLLRNAPEPFVTSLITDGIHMVGLRDPWGYILPGADQMPNFSRIQRFISEDSFIFIEWE